MPRKEDGKVNFLELIAYIKQAGSKILTFFPSKTDMISVVKDGNVTDELLSEQLETIETKLYNLETKNVLTFNLKDASADVKSSFGYLGELTKDKINASGTSAYAYVISQLRNGIVYVSSDFTIGTTVTQSKGGIVSFYAGVGYYMIDAGGTIGVATTSGMSIAWKPLGGVLKIPLE